LDVVRHKETSPDVPDQPPADHCQTAARDHSISRILPDHV